MGRLIPGLLCLALIISCERQPQPYQWDLPEGFPEPLVPADNPMTTAKVALGRQLFYDTNLSVNGQQACASCHQQQYAFAEPRRHAIGATGESHRRNSMALINLAYSSDFTWAHNGLQRIEQQLLIPMFGEFPVELGITGHETEVLSRFQSDRYKVLFAEAFPGQQISFDLVVKALASFVRSLVSFDSPFDRYAYQYQDDALSESAKRGLNLFFLNVWNAIIVMVVLISLRPAAIRISNWIYSLFIIPAYTTLTEKVHTLIAIRA